MRHFIVTLTFEVPFESFGDAVARHRAFLDGGYSSGLLLMSGPRAPRTGGIVLARAASMEELRAFFANDPYKLEGLATHDFVEFSPVKSQPFLADWVA